MASRRSKSAQVSYFEKRLLEIDRCDSLDASINIGKSPNREKILVHIYEESNITVKEHFYILDDILKIGASSIKNQIFLLDSEADEEQFEVFYDHGFVFVKSLSDKGCIVHAHGAISSKKIPLYKGESTSIRNNDSLTFGNTTLTFELFSNKNGLIDKRKKET